MNRVIYGMAIATLVCGIASPTYAAKLPRFGVFIYSSVCWEKQSGDAAGHRAMLVRDGEGDRIFWEWSDGPMEGPVEAHPLTIDDKSSKIRFSVDIGSQNSVDSAGHFVGKEAPDIQTFTGTISDSALILGPEGAPNRKGVIPRVTDFSAKTGYCR
jgi:hypothetical protein